MGWKVKNSKSVLLTPPFGVEELHLCEEASSENLSHPYYRLLSRDWVTVVAVTTEKKVILVRQTRAGTLGDELETPGGVINHGEKDPTLAAVRELEEETGYRTQTFLSLGSINPNPAIMGNRLHMFLALGCQPVSAESRKFFPDESENITLEFLDVDEIEAAVRHGQINSALSSLAIMLALKYLT